MHLAAGPQTQPPCSNCRKDAAKPDGESVEAEAHHRVQATCFTWPSQQHQLMTGAAEATRTRLTAQPAVPAIGNIAQVLLLLTASVFRV
jgi:hypothetical protein